MKLMIVTGNISLGIIPFIRKISAIINIFIVLILSLVLLHHLRLCVMGETKTIVT